MPNLNFKTFGQGYPIIILHGLFGALDNWKTFARLLSEEYMVFIIDQRDHGKSPHTEDFSYELLAQDLLEFMDENWIQEAIIIGHSMGGKATMKFALEEEDRVKKAIIVDIGPEATKPRHISIMDALSSVDGSKINDRKQIDDQLAETIKDIGVRQFLMKNFSRKKEGGFELKFNLPLLKDQYDEINKAIMGDPIETEILFVKGENSDYLQMEDIVEIRKTFSNAQMLTIEKAGHWIHAEQPMKLLEIVKSYIKDV